MDIIVNDVPVPLVQTARVLSTTIYTDRDSITIPGDSSISIVTQHASEGVVYLDDIVVAPVEAVVEAIVEEEAPPVLKKKGN